MKTESPVYILSAYQSGLNREENEKRHAALLDELIVIGATKPVEGCFDGIRERSIVLVPFDVTISHDHIRNILERYRQKCALHLDSNRAASLVYLDQTKHVGQWKPVHRKPDGDYTFDPSRNQYYIVEPVISGAVSAYNSLNGREQ